ncbi:hypothetical protein [Pseudoduganella aquatica]|uniref:Uncharacterized protein n=1 Tax=Pseudoduganella aquatica TaxID=2660641 RepID=A0A7X4H6R0_9BURK|nr:hypothetical protein [Pseudoduganella aquatica]MYN05751.1 hypothetical protein [Pseudoduganella aquatica]
MKNSQQCLPLCCSALILVATATLLPGCGGGAGGPEQQQAGVAASDVAAYAATLAYCGSQEPGGSGASADSFEVTWPTHSGPTDYDVNAIVSPAGYINPTGPAQRLQVDIHDYRGAKDTVLKAAYIEPAWKMGIAFQPALAPKSVACVASLGKLTPIPKGGYTLAWRSKWASAVPVERVPGAVFDGFELVSNFSPANATVFFVMAKSRIASTAGASICYLAPTSQQWDCAAASVNDLGTNWSFNRLSSQEGVYVLTVPGIG